ncbi:putative Geranylgeranyl pyrophosphate synthase [Cardiosporidium cionae]|uniref:Geranylgeranyl pyrophosphate synthase n=1 Tax=Cardiosporidium cionae TaxID=476202 RepID=A0ABQ7JCK6_9APIC|nr:putative Geranylgeranyl pyrophosphate synthase [Cardiosporidium cionae]|eukprot:KAF8821711.1 putative Geranylgeranyl pyrophosphate synthase [Cardiosporidium cionae]
MLSYRVENSSVAFLSTWLPRCSPSEEKTEFGTDKLYNNSTGTMPNPHNPFLDMLLTFLCLIIYSIVSRTQGTLVAYSVYISSSKKSNRIGGHKYPFALTSRCLARTSCPLPSFKLGKCRKECEKSLNRKDCLPRLRELPHHSCTSALIESHNPYCTNSLQNGSLLQHQIQWIPVAKVSPQRSCFKRTSCLKAFVHSKGLFECTKRLASKSKITFNAKPKQSSLARFKEAPEKILPHDVPKRMSKRHSQILSPAPTSGVLPSRNSCSREETLKSSPSSMQPDEMSNEEVDIAFRDVISDEKFEVLLRTKRKAIDTALEAALPLDKGMYPTATVLNEAMRYTLLSEAKRVRPIGCIFACETLGGTQEECMPTAVAIEMIHSMSLIHDDLPAMDNDCLRRGKATNHLIYGEDISILAGDALLAAAYTHVAKFSKGLPPDRIVEIIRRLGESAGLDGIAGGQSLDLRREGATNVTREELQWIHKHKTGSLLKVAVSTGAIIAGAKKEEIERMENFAEKIGLAFQVADDILDVTQSTFILGKTAGKDAVTKKLSYPRLFGLKESKKIVKRLILEAIEELSPFQERAIPLIKLAHYISSRSK